MLHNMDTTCKQSFKSSKGYSISDCTTDQSVPSLNLSVAECSLGIVCASIPALRPIAQRLLPNRLRSTALAPSNTHIQDIPLSNLPSKPNSTTPVRIETNTGLLGSQESLTRAPV